jgi:TonB family protein
MRRVTSVLAFYSLASILWSPAAAEEQGDASSRNPLPLRSPASVDIQNCARPSYPIEAARAAATGTTRVAYEIDVDGSVIASKVERSAGPTPAHNQLDQAALAALSRCKFRTAIAADGTPVRAWARVDYVWQLDGPMGEPITVLRQAADRGNRDAEMQLGLLLEQGVGVPRNVIQSVQWYRKAAELGDRRGQSALAWAYFFGRGIAAAEVLLQEIDTAKRPTVNVRCWPVPGRERPRLRVG